MREQALKTVLSVIAVILFGVVGIAVFEFSPFHVGFAAGPKATTRVTAGAAATLPQLPVPPETDLAFKTDTASGTHLRYESRLSFEDLWAFYVRQMPLCGWARSDMFEAARRSRAPQEPVLAFKSPGATCIITFEETGVFTTSVTVLVLASPGRGLETL